MRLERLNADKIKIFLTFDDLNERGIKKEELWQDLPKVHQLFRDMMTEASAELGFIAEGQIAVEVFSLPAQGMVVIVSKGESSPDLIEDDEYIEMQVTLDESDEIFYEFQSFEDVIGLAGRLYPLGIDGGALYSFHSGYFLFLHPDEMASGDYDMTIALLSEFGSPSTTTTHRVQEYGKTLMPEKALENIYLTFLNK